MLAPSLSTSTCMATIPASIKPSSGIQTRPRTRRSSHAWSGSRLTAARSRAFRGAETLGAGGALGRRRGAADGSLTRRLGAASSPASGPEIRRGAAGAGRARTGARSPSDRSGRSPERILRSLGRTIRSPDRGAGELAPPLDEPGRARRPPPRAPFLVPPRPAGVIAAGVIALDLQL